MPTRYRIVEPESVILDAVEQVATELDEGGNQGMYAKYLTCQGRWVMSKEYKPYRDGILYYSEGHGWRVRKNPHWKTVLQQKRAEMKKPITLEDKPE